VAVDERKRNGGRGRDREGGRHATRVDEVDGSSLGETVERRGDPLVVREATQLPRLAAEATQAGPGPARVGPGARTRVGQCTSIAYVGRGRGGRAAGSEQPGVALREADHARIDRSAQPRSPCGRLVRHRVTAWTGRLTSEPAADGVELSDDPRRFIGQRHVVAVQNGVEGIYRVRT
jgi:hypothetical protein